MSYFVCGFKNDTECINNLAKILDEVIPYNLRDTGHLIEGSFTKLIMYGNKKMIPDVIV
jgi:hypothetical protein